MRFLLALLALAGPAEASSIVLVEPMTQELGPSMVMVEDETTPSIVALGEPADIVPPVTDETVAAIPETSPLREPVPMVIRGGIVGGAFSTPAPAAVEESPAQAAEETAAAPEAEEPEPEMPKEEAPAAPAPSGPPPLLGAPE